MSDRSDKTPPSPPLEPKTKEAPGRKPGLGPVPTLGKITPARKSASEIASEATSLFGLRGKAKPASAKTPATKPVTKAPAPAPLPGSPVAAEANRRWSARTPMSVGLVSVVALVGGFGIWGGTASISGAVVAMGQIEVEANRQVIQHPDGGVVGEILVKDGDKVATGDVLIRLDDTRLQSDLNVAEAQLYEIMARRQRLIAERDRLDDVTFDEPLLALAQEREDVAALLEGQLRQFRIGRESRERRTAQLRERQQQTENQIVGIIAQNDAMSEQLALIEKELVDKRGLLERGLGNAPEVYRLEREASSLKGRVGEFIASIAQAKGRIAEIEIEIDAIETEIRREAITTLRDLEYREVELRERRLTILEQLSRTDIRSPVNGIIYGNTVFALRAVLRSAEPIMYVVPIDSDLVITTRVEPINIDEVHVGQAATLRFSAFNMRDTPELEGTITQVSADAFMDEARGISYFTAQVAPNDGELARLEGRELLPGMPVEAYIKTGERTALNYIIRPFMDYFNQALREE
ncbi:MAG: HlyD family type I secretion periplasmic adaptor subunit [Pseudomonadota bacterium]